MLALLVLAGLFGANPTPVDLAIRGYTKPVDGSCAVNASSMPSMDNLVLDTAESFSLRIPLIVENTSTTAIVPWLVDVAFECDPSVLDPNPGALILPEYSSTFAFCLDTTDPNSKFVGRDILPLSGRTLLPGARTIVRLEIVPFPLGASVDELLTMASLADRCCQTPGTACDASIPGAPGCLELDALLTSSMLLPHLSLKDALVLRRFAMFDANYWDGVLTQRMASLPTTGARYPLQVHMLMEGISESGYAVYSSEAVIPVSFCRGCGTRMGAVRAPFEVSRCLH
jgi:hypothetical protein